jgi:hypothetical protein
LYSLKKMLKYKNYLEKTLNEIEIFLPQFKMALLSNLFYKHAYYLMEKNNVNKIVLHKIGHIPLIVMEKRK